MSPVETTASATHSRSRSRLGRISLIAAIALSLIATLFGAAPAASAQDVAPDQPTEADRPVPVPDVERLRLKCRTASVGDQRGVLCKWSEANDHKVRAYHLYRIVNGQPRELLKTVGPDGRLAYFDRDVSAPAKIVYGVVARNHGGDIVARGVARVALGERREEIRLNCARANIEGTRGIACRWSDPTEADARGFVLRRSVDGEAREVIARIPAAKPNTHFDTDIEPGSVHIYYVTAVDAAGDVIAFGGPVRLRWPAG